ncbi:hypothetical protein OG568_47615 [Streptomyces sp. NBC_01450]|uniref:hypothetical protein n=1 Tax=Streptomyces sp. NBC_01450 TaxID=2903871 RepID=UPI002E33F474|nr:hypothetical protein [Streptomyces sp. NBC_01450]
MHHSFTQYRLPSTGELVPLLQIAPSKTDTERLLLASLELADFLSTMISHLPGINGAVPLVASYAIRPGEEYRTPTGQEWDAFLAHFEKRKVSIGTCARAFRTCIHEHACVR